MGIIEKMLRYDFCVYWALLSNESGGVAYDENGRPQYTTAVQLACRWEDTLEEFVDSQGTRQMSQSVVYVESDVQVGGMLFHGELTDLAVLTDPRAIDNVWEIKRFDKLPKLKYTEFLRTAYL